jgi:hypothetical protein
MSPFAAWADVLVGERIADLHQQAERQRLARRVREGRARPVTAGALSARAHPARGLLGGLRRLLGSRGLSGTWAEEPKRPVPVVGAEGALRGELGLADPGREVRTRGALPAASPRAATNGLLEVTSHDA